MLGKIIIIFSIAVISWCNCSAQARVCFFAGPQTSIAKYSILNVKQPTEFKYGLHAGIAMKVNFDDHLFFFPAISYSNTGYKVKFNRSASPPDSSAKDNNTNFHQVDVDLHLQFDAGNHPSHFFLRAGPSFNFIISGKEKFHLTTGEFVNRKMKLGLYSPYGRILVSFVTSLGYETSSGFYFNLQYAHGLSSLNNADNGPQILQRVIGCNVGIYLHSKKIVLDTKNKE
jgi:hypothetical protein